jgi:DNA primase
MDIDSRNFVDVMKELSNQTGIELPKDNQDNKKLFYKRSSQTITKTAPTVAQESHTTPPLLLMTIPMGTL